MKARGWDAIGWVAIGLGGFALLFFFVPLVPMVPLPCITGGDGYGSASAYLFSLGATYVHGNFGWLTPVLANCI